MQIYDEIFEKIKENEKNVMDSTKGVSEDIRNILQNYAGEQKGNGEALKHCFLAMAKVLCELCSAYYNSEEEYAEAYKKAKVMVVEKMIPASLVGDEEEKLTTSDYMLSSAVMIDYIFWRLELNNYSNLREDMEKKEQVK